MQRPGAGPRDGGAGGPAPGRAYSGSIKRIQRELKEISESPSRHWTAAPVADDFFEWHFALRGPPGTDFEGGIYTGRVVLPVNYPLAPPSVTLLTPNGRWEVGKKICLSNTNFHPEQWQPAWGIRTMMEALRSHFPVPGDGAVGSIDWPSDLRQRLAKESLDFVTQPGGVRNRELLPELSPEELKEEQSEVVPPVPEVAPPAAQIEAAPLQAPASLVQSEVLPLPAERPPLPSSSADSTLAASTEGLRQRRGAEGVAAAAAPAFAAATAASGVAAASSSSEAPPPALRRQRSELARSQRRSQRPLLVQLFKPPQGRGWVLFVMDMLIGLFIVSFLVGLVDICRDPPTLLDPLPEPKKQE